MGLGAVIGLAARAWAPFFFVAGIGVLVGFPRPPRWVCEQCGIIFTRESLKDQRAEPSENE